MNKPNDSNDPVQSDTLDLRIADAVASWMELDQSERPSASDWASRFPDLAPGLQECLDGVCLVESAAGDTTGDSTIVGADDAANFPEIPDFEILSELGRGGMGIVYEARQLSLDRIVALKVLPIGTVDQRAVERFTREAETVAALDHQNIVPVYAVGVHNGLHWYAMQRIDGVPLSMWFAHHNVRSRSETIDEVVRVGIEAAEALEHAHRRGVIHRDVKPGNLLVDTLGKVWLTDFGVARRDVDVTATATGAMVGTPRYMSPEQIIHTDEDIDERTDVYSLGATLYEMATGRPPFASESPLQLLTQIQQDEPVAPRQLDPSIPRPLELVILKCLDKEPQRRYLTVAAAAADLKAVRDHQPISARGLPIWVTAHRFAKRHSQQLRTTAVAIVTTGIAIATLIVLWQQSQRANLASVLINSPAGLCTASIHSKSANGKQNELQHALTVTTPMQQPVNLPAGDYVVRMESMGKPSELVDLHTDARQSVEMKYVDRREDLPQIDIHNKLAMNCDDGGLAVLGPDSFKVFDADAELRFTIDTSELAEGLVEEETKKTAYQIEDDPPLSFGFDPNQPFQGDFNVADSSFARVQRLSDQQVDLNGDGRPDFLLSASRHAAIAAVASDGELLWKQRLPMSFETVIANRQYPWHRMPKEVIVGIMPVKDLNGDSIDDLVVNAALFDPNGFSRPVIFTLSGHDGSELAKASFPTVDMSKASTWPWSGLLPLDRSWNSAKRSERRVHSHYFFGAIRRSIHVLHNMRWSHSQGGDSGAYVLPDPVLHKTEDERLIAATIVGNTVRFVDTQAGQVLGGSVAVPDSVCRGPIDAKLSNGEFGVFVMTGIRGNGYTTCKLHLCVLGESKPRWSIDQRVSARELFAGAADGSFPFVAKLTNTGETELITTTNEPMPFEWPVLECYNAKTGELRWQSQPIAGVALACEHALTVGDVDDDGFADLAVVGLASSSPISDYLASKGLLLVVDIISGRDGKRIGFREEQIDRALEMQTHVEIDSVEFDGSKLVCAVVHGLRQELKLSSVTVAFDMRQLTPAILSRGLTPLGATQTGQTASPKKRGSWFRRRSGAFAAPADSAVWIKEEKKTVRFSSETLIASWVSPTGQPRILLGNRQSTARCINPLNGKVLWSKEKFSYSGSIRCVKAGDATELLLSRNDHENVPPVFYDAETGYLKYQIDTPEMGEIKYIDPDENDPQHIAYALADAGNAPVQSGLGHLSSRSGHDRKGLRLMKIDRAQKRVVWSMPCYNAILANHGSDEPSRLLQMDVNRDGVTDLITGNANGGPVAIQAINGIDGTPIWSIEMEFIGNEKTWPYDTRWPMMQLVQSGSADYLVIVDADPQDDRKMQIKCLNPELGEVFSHLTYKCGSELSSVRRRGIALSVLHPDQRDGLIGFKVEPPNSRFCDWYVAHVDEQGVLHEKQRFDTSHHPLITADVNDDGKLDRIDRLKDKVRIHQGDSGQLLGEFDLPKNANHVFVETVGKKTYLRAYVKDQEHFWLELPDGQVKLRDRSGFQPLTHPGKVHSPRTLLLPDQTLLVGSTSEAVVCRSVDIGTTDVANPKPAFPIAMHSPSIDERYQRPVTALGIYEHLTIGRILWRALRALGGIVLPIGFIFFSVRRRQFSLQRLLMVPAVFLLAMMAWRAQMEMANGRWISEWIVGVVSIVSFLSLLYLVVRGHWKQIAICILVSVVVGTLLMKGAESLIAINRRGMTGYWTLSNWSAAVLAIGFQLVLPAAAILERLGISAGRIAKVFRISRRRQTRNKDVLQSTGQV